MLHPGIILWSSLILSNCGGDIYLRIVSMIITLFVTGFIASVNPRLSGGEIN